jgi:hypothetical protein
MRAWMLAATLLLGCGGDEKGAGEDSAATGDTGSADTAGPEVRPSVLAVRSAACTTNGDGVDIWVVAVDVTDPQGDIAAVGSTLTVRDGGEDLAEYALACSSDTCSGSWRNTDSGSVGCDLSGSAVFRIVVVDEMGNASEPYDHRPG